MKLGIKITKQEIEEKLPLLTETQKTVVETFYGIGRPARKDILSLSRISNLSFYQAEKTLIEAITIIKNIS